MSHDEQVYVCVFAVLNCDIETQILIFDNKIDVIISKAAYRVELRFDL